jgi:hypothetical protein
MSYRPCEPQQEMLLPASLQDWLPKGHLAYFISDAVDALDLKEFYARYKGGGACNQGTRTGLGRCGLAITIAGQAALSFFLSRLWAFRLRNRTSAREL